MTKPATGVEMAVEHRCERHGRPAVASRCWLRPDGTQETEYLWDTLETSEEHDSSNALAQRRRPLKTATTDENTVVLLADFYRAGDESFIPQMILAADDVASDIVWIHSAGGASAITNFSS